MIITTIIFDLDGTLLDTVQDVHFCSNAALREMGLPPISLAQAKRSIGPGSDTFSRITLGEEHMHRFGEFIKIYRKYYRDKCIDKTRPFPGIIEVLQQLQDTNLLVATNKPLKYTNVILENLQLMHYFKSVLGPEDVAHPKPEPDMILLGLQRVGDIPERTLMVGDTDNDIAAARAANVISCAACWGYGDAESLKNAKPDFFSETPASLLDIIINERTQRQASL